MQSMFKAFAAIGVSGLLLAGCSQQAAVNSEAEVDGSMEATEEGTFSTGTELPSDWPADVTIYPGATVQFSGTATPQDGQLGWAVVLVTTDSVEQVKDYYRADLAKQGWSVSADMESQGTAIIGANKDARAVSMTAAPSGQGQTTVTIGVAQQ